MWQSGQDRLGNVTLPCRGPGREPTGDQPWTGPNCTLLTLSKLILDNCTLALFKARKYETAFIIQNQSDFLMRAYNEGGGNVFDLSRFTDDHRVDTNCCYHWGIMQRKCKAQHNTLK